MNEENKIPLPGDGDAKPKAPDFLQGDDWFDVDIGNDFLDFDKPYRPPRYTMEREGYSLSTPFTLAKDVSEKVITFDVKAFDEAGEIGKGTHKRVIVPTQKFLEKAYNKL